MAITTARKAVTRKGLVGSSPTSSALTISYRRVPISRVLSATRTPKKEIEKITERYFRPVIFYLLRDHRNLFVLVV